MDTAARKHALGTLAAIAACPATSYYEKRVITHVLGRMRKAGLTPRQDAYGNILAAWTPGPTLPSIAFVAHMDHPGFELQAADGGRLTARALGGVPPASFEKEYPVRLFTADGDETGKGMTAGRLGPEADQKLTIRLTTGRLPPLPGFAVWDLPDYKLDGDMVRMRALDDLAGCAATLLVLESMAKEKVRANVYGLFTRAEESGLIGARLAARDGFVPKDALVVSIESSKTLPGAAQGQGPVIRVGDASYTFDGAAEQLLVRARRRLMDKDAGFKAQRQLMSGGTCEATAFALQGYRATGLAFPLGNYHNATDDRGVDLESIHADDFTRGVELLAEAVRVLADPSAPPSDLARRLATVSEEDQRRLKESQVRWG